MAPYEADPFIARLSQCRKDNKLEYFAVISNDSDFFVYNTPGYIPLDEIRFIESPVGEIEIICRKFTAASIAQCMGIKKTVCDFLKKLTIFTVDAIGCFTCGNRLFEYERIATISFTFI
jgi:hypothetical protein